jgi:hypothetical protein
MRTMMNVLVGSTVALVVGVSFAASSNARDLTKDEAYCRKLVDLYRGGGHGLEGWSESLDLSVADDQCWSGNPEPAIPVLEKRLRDMGYTVPPRS